MIDKNYSLTLPQWKSLCIVGRVISRHQGLSFNDQGRQRRESIETRLDLLHQYGRPFIVLEHQYGCRDVM